MSDVRADFEEWLRRSYPEMPPWQAQVAMQMFGGGRQVVFEGSRWGGRNFTAEAVEAFVLMVGGRVERHDGYVLYGLPEPPLLFHAVGDEAAVQRLKLRAEVPVNARPVPVDLMQPGQAVLVRDPDALAETLRPVVHVLVDLLQRVAPAAVGAAAGLYEVVDVPAVEFPRERLNVWVDETHEWRPS